ncbi:hypothetical protein ABNF65_23530 [Paenibacillus larvae]
MFTEQAKQIVERQIELLAQTNESLKDDPEQLRKNAETIIALINFRLPIDRKFDL